MELLHYLDLETTWLNTLEERMKNTDMLPEKTEAVGEALEVGVCAIRGISFYFWEATEHSNEACDSSHHPALLRLQ